MHRVRRWYDAHPVCCYAIISACLVLLFYRDALGGRFVYDDIDHIANNPALRSWSLFFHYYLERGVAFSGDFRPGPPGYFYRPLFWLSLALDRWLFGLKPMGFHLTNLLLHWADGLLGFALLRKLGVTPKRAAAVMVVWLLLPINSEAVAWISGRTYLLCTLFLLLALLAAEAYLRSNSRLAMLGYGGGFAMSLLSHEAGLLVLPFTLLLEITRGQRRLFSQAGIWAVGFGLAVGYFLLRRALGISSWVHLSSVSSTGVTFWKYVGWILLPVHMSVERSSDLPQHSSPLLSTVTILAVILLGVAAFLWRKRLPGFAGGVGWTLLALLPYCGFVFIYQGMAERYTYLASLGLVLSIVSLVWAAQTKQLRLFVWPCLFLWVIWGAWRLDARVKDWQDEVTLYSSSLKTDPNSPILLYNLALRFDDDGDLRTAILLTKRALAIKPGYERATNGLGTMYLRSGSLAEAKEAFEKALTLDPGDEQAMCNLGIAYLRMRRFYEASVRFERAIAMQPNDVRALTNLASTNVQMGELAAGETTFRRVIAVDPSNNVARCDLGMVLFGENKWDQAVEQLTAAIKNDPSDANPYFFLGLVEEKMGAPQAAVDMYKKAIQLRPDYAPAQSALKRLLQSK